VSKGEKSINYIFFFKNLPCTRFLRMQVAQVANMKLKTHKLLKKVKENKKTTIKIKIVCIQFVTYVINSNFNPIHL